MRVRLGPGTLAGREEDPVSIVWTIVVYLYVVGVLACVGAALWWLRPHH
jgi:hypothetical protein